MNISDLRLSIFTAAGTVVVAAIARLVWWALGRYRIAVAGPRPLWATRHVLWREPSDEVARLQYDPPHGE